MTKILQTLPVGERVGIGHWIAILVSFVGALIIIQPGSGHLPWQAVFVLGVGQHFREHGGAEAVAEVPEGESLDAVYQVLQTQTVPFHGSMLRLTRDATFRLGRYGRAAVNKV